MEKLKRLDTILEEAMEIVNLKDEDIEKIIIVPWKIINFVTKECVNGQAKDK